MRTVLGAVVRRRPHAEKAQNDVAAAAAAAKTPENANTKLAVCNVLARSAAHLLTNVCALRARRGGGCRGVFSDVCSVHGI